MKVIRYLAISIATIALATGCQQVTTTAEHVAKSGNVERTVAVFSFSDAVTGSTVDLVTGDTATIFHKGTAPNTMTITGTESAHGVIDFANDRIIVYNIEKAEEFTLKVNKTGYKAFEGRDKFISTTKSVTPIDGNYVYIKSNSKDLEFYEAALFPSVIPFTTQAIEFSVLNADTGLAITTGGRYIIKPVNNVIVSAGTTTGAKLLPQYINPSSPQLTYGTNGIYKGYVVEGAVSATGTISIPAGALFSGLDYNIRVIGVPGYNDNGTTTNFTANGSANTSTFAINLTPVTGTYVESSNTFRLIATNNINTSGQLIRGVRSIILTFNKPIEVTNPNLLSGNRLSNLILLSTTNTDGDTFGTTLGTTALQVAGSLPPGLTITASGATLTITLAATDEDLTTNAATPGTLDIGDALQWNLDVIFGSINVRAVDATNETQFVQLSTFTTSANNGVRTLNGAIVPISVMDEILVR